SDFLAANYDLEDHRGEESYALWDENSFVRGREIEVQELKEFPSVGEYLDWVIGTRDYTVVAYTAGGHIAPDVDIMDDLTEAGIGPEFYEAGGVWVYDDGKLVYATGEEDDLYHKDLGNSNLVITREEGVNTVLVDKQNCQTVSDGINFVVYDKVLGEVVDKAGFWATYSYGLAR
uniref:hypothetical protein n=1 Tax=Acetatifactor sp. TaxID=1872090 RepID=UPI0040562EB3